MFSNVKLDYLIFIYYILVGCLVLLQVMWDKGILKIFGLCLGRYMGLFFFKVINERILGFGENLYYLVLFYS